MGRHDLICGLRRLSELDMTATVCKPDFRYCTINTLTATSTTASSPVQLTHLSTICFLRLILVPTGTSKRGGVPGVALPPRIPAPLHPGAKSRCWLTQVHNQGGEYVQVCLVGFVFLARGVKD